MNEAQQVVYLEAQIMCARIEMEGMKSENIERVRNGHAQAHDESAFMDVIEKWGIHHNAVLTLFNG